MPESAVTYQGARKVYGSGENETIAITGVDLEIDDGDFVVFVGPSGCGKTTLLHLTAGLIQPTEGEILVRGKHVSDTDFQREDLGLVFQEPILLDWRTVKDNILLPIQILVENNKLDGSVKDYEADVEDLLNLTGLDGFGDSYPMELSGGMQQRVSICRSLIYDPSVLLMDEPFGALDAFTRQKMNIELLRIWQETEKTVLFVTHDLDEAVFLADRVVVLSPRPGRIVDTVDISLERPRTQETLESDEFRDHVSHVQSYFTDLEEETGMGGH